MKQKTTMKQKTAIRQAIQKTQEAKENFPAIGFDEEFVRGFNKAFQMAIFISEKFESVNEQQIKDAYVQGGYDHLDVKATFNYDEIYFNETFER